MYEKISGSFLVFCTASDEMLDTGLVLRLYCDSEVLCLRELQTEVDWHKDVEFVIHTPAICGLAGILFRGGNLPYTRGTFSTTKAQV